MLPFRNGRSHRRGSLLVLILITIFSLAANPSTAKEPKKSKSKISEKDAGNGAASIPIPIGQEAKGITLPDYDLEGHIRGRFFAGAAKRIDENHLELRNLKMHTFTPEEKPDLDIDMTTSILDLKTHVLSSRERTTVRRADFQLSGNSMEFNTATRQGTLVGDVKMTLNGKSLVRPEGE